MSVAKPLTADLVILDGDVIRNDWDGSPRFYSIRISPQDRGCYKPLRVQIYVCLEGDPTAWSINFCDDNAEDINEAVMDCVSDIEDLCASQWDREQEAGKRDCLTSYERGFGY